MQLVDLTDQDLVFLYYNRARSIDEIEKIITSRLPNFTTDLLVNIVLAESFPVEFCLKAHYHLRIREDIKDFQLKKLAQETRHEPIAQDYFEMILQLPSYNDFLYTFCIEGRHAEISNQSFELLSEIDTLYEDSIVILIHYGATEYIQMESFKKYKINKEFVSLDLFEICKSTALNEIAFEVFEIYKISGLYCYAALVVLMDDAKLQYIREEAQRLFEEHSEAYTFMEKELGLIEE
jgi:hypothetical protein